MRQEIQTTIFDVIPISSDVHPKYSLSVERAKKAFLSKSLISLGLSGKDSACALICAVEGLKQAKEIDQSVGPLYVVTTNTTLDNMVLHDYMLTLHDDVKAYGLEHDLPIYTKELRPTLSNNPMVEIVGRGKLLRTPETSSRGRDCAAVFRTH